MSQVLLASIASDRNETFKTDVALSPAKNWARVQPGANWFLMGFSIRFHSFPLKCGLGHHLQLRLEVSVKPHLDGFHVDIDQFGSGVAQVWLKSGSIVSNLAQCKCSSLEPRLSRHIARLKYVCPWSILLLYHEPRLRNFRQPASLMKMSSGVPRDKLLGGNEVCNLYKLDEPQKPQLAACVLCHQGFNTMQCVLSPLCALAEQPSLFGLLSLFLTGSSRTCPSKLYASCSNGPGHKRSRRRQPERPRDSPPIRYPDLALV